jgi:hypothetical protein
VEGLTVDKIKAPRPGTIRWAAEKLCYSVPVTRGLIAAGKLRAYGTGHRTRISDQAIADCIALLESEAAAARKAAA